MNKTENKQYQGLLSRGNEAERAAQTPEDEALRMAYQSMRYAGAAPEWRPQPSRVGVLVPALAFALLCSLAVWWLWPYGAIHPSGLQESSKVLIAEAEPTPEPRPEPRQGFSVPGPKPDEPILARGSKPSRASAASADVARSGQGAGGETAPPRTALLGVVGAEARESLRSGPVEHSATGASGAGDTDGTGEIAESGVRHIGLDARAEPKDLNEGLQRLRSGARSLRQAGVALPVAQPHMSFRLPKVPDYRPSRPSLSPTHWSADEGAARD